MFDMPTTPPRVTVALLRQLIDDGRDNAVLCLDDEYRLRIWVQERAGDIVARREDLLRPFIGPITDEEIEDYLLESVQRTVDERHVASLRLDASLRQAAAEDRAARERGDQED